LQIIESRSKENLSLGKILFYTLIPSRFIHNLFKVSAFDAYKALEQGYRRKVNQYYFFSILGEFFYLLVLVISCFIHFNK